MSRESFQITVGGITFDDANSTVILLNDDYNADLLKKRTPQPRKIVFSKGVTNVKDYSFNGMQSVEEVVFSNTIKTIGAQALRYMLNIKSLVIPDSVESIGMSAFQDCKNLESVKLSENLKTLGNNMFMGCESLVKVTIPDSVENFGSTELLFTNCYALKEVVFGEKCDSLAFGCFMNCKAIKNINLTGNIVNIKSYAIFNCQNLESVFLGQQLEAIDMYAFYNCKALKYMNLPSNVTLNPKFTIVCPGLMNLKQFTYETTGTLQATPGTIICDQLLINSPSVLDLDVRGYPGVYSLVGFTNGHPEWELKSSGAKLTFNLEGDDKWALVVNGSIVYKFNDPSAVRSASDIPTLRYDVRNVLNYPEPQVESQPTTTPGTYIKIIGYENQVFKNSANESSINVDVVYVNKAGDNIRIIPSIKNTTNQGAQQGFILKRTASDADTGAPLKINDLASSGKVRVTIKLEPWVEINTGYKLKLVMAPVGATGADKLAVSQEVTFDIVSEIEGFSLW